MKGRGGGGCQGERVGRTSRLTHCPGRVLWLTALGGRSGATDANQSPRPRGEISSRLRAAGGGYLIRDRSVISQSCCVGQEFGFGLVVVWFGVLVVWGLQFSFSLFGKCLGIRLGSCLFGFVWFGLVWFGWCRRSCRRFERRFEDVLCSCFVVLFSFLVRSFGRVWLVVGWCGWCGWLVWLGRWLVGVVGRGLFRVVVRCGSHRHLHKSIHSRASSVQRLKQSSSTRRAMKTRPREAGFQKQGGILGDWLGVGFAGTGREKQVGKRKTRDG